MTRELSHEEIIARKDRKILRLREENKFLRQLGWPRRLRRIPYSQTSSTASSGHQGRAEPSNRQQLHPLRRQRATLSFHGQGYQHERDRRLDRIRKDRPQSRPVDACKAWQGRLASGTLHDPQRPGMPLHKPRLPEIPVGIISSSRCRDAETARTMHLRNPSSAPCKG